MKKNILILTLLLILGIYTFSDKVSVSKDSIKLDIDTGVKKALENNLSLN